MLRGQVQPRLRVFRSEPWPADGGEFSSWRRGRTRSKDRRERGLGQSPEALSVLGEARGCWPRTLGEGRDRHKQSKTSPRERSWGKGLGSARRHPSPGSHMLRPTSPAGGGRDGDSQSGYYPFPIY